MQQGILVTFARSIEVYRPGPSFQLMLLSADNWLREPFIPAGPDGRYFFLLTDGIPVCYSVVRPHAGSFREEVAAALQYATGRTTMQAAIPPISDFSHQGVECEKVVVFTERVSRIPIPPGRPLAPQYVVFLDQRAILRGLDWLLAERGRVSLDTLQGRYADAVPPFFKLAIDGGVWEDTAAGTIIQVTSGESLCISFVEDLPSSEGVADDSMWRSSQEDDSDDDDSSDESSESGDEPPGSADNHAVSGAPPGAPDEAAEVARSRSPRQVHGPGASGHRPHERPISRSWLRIPYAFWAEVCRLTDTLCPAEIPALCTVCSASWCGAFCTLLSAAWVGMWWAGTLRGVIADDSRFATPATQFFVDCLALPWRSLRFLMPGDLEDYTHWSGSTSLFWVGILVGCGFRGFSGFLCIACALALWATPCAAVRLPATCPLPCTAPGFGAALPEKPVKAQHCIPTPCRSLRLPCFGAAAASDDSDSDDEGDSFVWDVLGRRRPACCEAVFPWRATRWRTLLQAAYQDPLCAGPALAAATLATLMEAYPPPGHPPAAGPSRAITISLAQSLPVADPLPGFVAVPVPAPVCGVDPAISESTTAAASTELAYGQLALGFSWQDLLAFLEPRISLATWDEIVSRFGSGPLLHLAQMPDHICHPHVNEIFLITDGSFTAHPNHEPCCGWACVVVDAGENSLGAFSGTFPPWHDFQAYPASVYLSECYALACAAWFAAASLPNRDLVFVADCTSALFGASGQQALDVDGPPGLMKALHQLCQTRRQQPCKYRYAPAHVGNRYNELADYLAKAAARQVFTGTFDWRLPHSSTAWWARGGAMLTWFSLVLARSSGNVSLPPPWGGPLGTDATPDPALLRASSHRSCRLRPLRFPLTPELRLSYTSVSLRTTY